MSSSIRTILTYALLCATVAADTKFNTVISSAEAPTFGALELGLTRHNASGHYPMRGADVSKPFPSNMVDGWKLEIDVAANVPITIGPAKGKYASAVGIWLNPPGALLADNGHGQDELLNAQVDSWYGCMNVFGIKGISGDAGNGTCSGLLSPNCTANIRKALINSAEATEGGRCPNLWNITDIVDSGCPLPEDEYATAFDFRHDFTTGYQVAYTSDTVDDVRNLSTYNKLATTTYPVIVTWGHTNKTGLRGPLSEDHVTIACVQANVTLSGSQTPVSSGMRVFIGRFGLMATTIGAMFALAFQ